LGKVVGISCTVQTNRTSESFSLSAERVTGEVSQRYETVRLELRSTGIVDRPEAPAVITAYTLLVERPTDRLGRSCLSKIPYLSRREARARVRDGRNQDGTLRPYRCQFCDLLHLGHRRRRL